MLEPEETRRKQYHVDRNGLAQKNTGSLQTAESEKWNYQEYTGAGGNNNRATKSRKEDLHGSVTWNGWKSTPTHKTLHCYIEGVRSREEVKGKRGLTMWKKIWRRKMQILKRRRNWYDTDRSGGISCSLIVTDENKEEDRSSRWW